MERQAAIQALDHYAGSNHQTVHAALTLAESQVLSSVLCITKILHFLFPKKKKLLTIGRTLTSSNSISILPIPQSQLAILSTSSSSTNGTGVSIGELVDFGVTISLPEGTILLPTVIVYLPQSAALLSVVNVSISSSSQISYPSSTIYYSTGNGINDTATISFPFIINVPDNVVNANDKILITVTALVLHATLNLNGNPITTTSSFTYHNGVRSYTETSQSVSIYMIQPVLSWTVNWNRTSGEAGTVIGCVVAIRHAATSSATAYNVAISALLQPYLNLVNNSLVSSESSAFFPGSTSLAGMSDLVVIPALVLGDSVSFGFSVVIDDFVPTASVIRTRVTVDYSSAPSIGGYHSYLITLFTVSLFMYFLTRQETSPEQQASAFPPTLSLT